MSSLLEEIEAVRDGAKSISYRYILERVGAPEYPEITALGDMDRKHARTALARALKGAGYVRRSNKSTCWLVPE